MKFKCCPVWSFGKKTKFSLEKTDSLITPGPGNYTPAFQKVRDSEPKWKIGTESKSKKTKDTNPGPGQYNISSNEIKGPKYTISVRTKALDLAQSTCSPGPAKYSPTKSYKSPKYSMGSRPRSAQCSSSPGPGYYNLKRDKSFEGPSYKFRLAKKDDLNISKIDNAPGPGNYLSIDNPKYKSQPKFTFSKERKTSQSRMQTPGPGEYRLKEFFGKEAPRISIRGKNTRNKKAYNEAKNSPGPGYYNSDIIKVRHASPAYKIGTQTRNKEIINKNPGPGQYDLDNFSKTVTSFPSWKMGKSKRHSLDLSDRSIPGVGNYNVTQELGHGPKYSIGKKIILEDNWKKTVPGPGKYNIDTQFTLNKNPSFSIGKSPRENSFIRVSRERTPGPGNYDCTLKDNGAKYGFGTEKRQSSSLNIVPGPGEYRIPCSIVDINDYTRESGNFDPDFRYV